MLRSARGLLAALLVTTALPLTAAADEIGGEGWTKLRTRPAVLPSSIEPQAFAPGIEHALAGEAKVYGHTLAASGGDGRWKVSVDGKPQRLKKGLPAVIKLGSGKDARALLLQDRGARLVWTAHWGVEVKLGKGSWWLIDADGDGKLWERGEDALIGPHSQTATPYLGLAWSEHEAWEVGRDKQGQVWSRAAAQPRAKADHPINDAWRLFNAWRQAAGLRAVSWDKEQARGARAHADYCERNQLRAIHEEEGKPGYSEDGDYIGRNSVCSWLYATPREGVLEVLSTAYSLSCALAPSMTSCAIGHNERSFCFSVNVDRSGDEHEGRVQWVWPPHGAQDVVRGFNDNGEVPMPVPGKELEHEQSIGHAVVAKVDPEAVRYRLTLTTAKGETIRGHFSSPKASVKHPVMRRGGNRGLVVFAPASRLPANTTFIARLEIDGDDESTTVRVWRFTTGSTMHRVICPLKKMGGMKRGGRRRR